MTFDERDILKEQIRRAEERGDYAIAASEMEKWLRLEPDEPILWIWQGGLYKELKYWAEAEKAYQTALDLDPENVWVIIALGDVYYLQELWDKAEASFRAALRISPEHPQANCFLGIVLYFCDCMLESETYLRRAIAVKPDNDEAFYNLGLTQLKLGRREEAIAAFEEALRIDPEYKLARAALEKTISSG